MTPLGSQTPEEIQKKKSRDKETEENKGSSTNPPIFNACDLLKQADPKLKKEKKSETAALPRTISSGSVSDNKILQEKS